MKKNLFLLMALAGAMVVMPGCSDDDGDNGGGGDKKPVYKRITSFVKEKSPVDNPFGGPSVTPKKSQTYTYDEAGQIVRMDMTEESMFSNSSGHSVYAYATSKIDVSGQTASGSMSNPIQPIEYSLSKGAATVINMGETDRYEASTETVEYDAAGYLSKITVSPGSDSELIYTFTYANEVLNKLVIFKKSNSRQDEFTFTYDKYENKGSIDLFAFLGEGWKLWNEHCNLFLLGIGGKRSAKVPVSVSWVVDWTDDEDPAEPAEVINYAYQTSSDGYVLQYTDGSKDDNQKLVQYKITYAAE